MREVYPIILTQVQNGFVVYVPDLQINTEGTDIVNAIEMARDAIGIWGICEQDMKREIPKAKDLNPQRKQGELLALVDIDFDGYRRANDNRTIRKNVSIPSWLNELAETNGVNFSQVLQDGLKNTLNVSK